MSFSGIEIAYLSAFELVELYATKKLSPVEAANVHADRIEKLNPQLNAYITPTIKLAHQQAKAAEDRYNRGAPLGPLDGVPFAAKDIFATRGIRTTHGSKLGLNNVPLENASVIDRLLSGGTVLLGKSNLMEFATGSGTDSGFGPTHNPWKLNHDPGGSSSGSGAALAAGMATLALGTDTGGSIRNPANRCSIVGLKPTFGRVSRHGVTPLAWTLDHAGPMARTVRDTARMLTVIAGYDQSDPASVSEPVPDFEKDLLRSYNLRGKRFALAKELMTPIEPEIVSVVEAALTHLEKLGARRTQVSIPSAVAANVASEVIIDSEAAVFHEQNLRNAERKKLLDPLIPYYLNSGRLYLATDYVKAQRLRLQLQAELNQALAYADVLVCPTDPTHAPQFGEPTLLLGRSVEWYEYGNVNLANLTGFPALSLPCGFLATGLPVGLQIIGRAFDESTVLAFAHAYEQSTDWHRQRPPLNGM